MGSGTVDGAGSAVLEDPSGKRAAWLRWAGRGVFVVFLAWLLAVVLGGLGLTPVVGIPFTHVLRPSQGPPALQPVQPRQPSVSDLRPATPAKAFAARVAPHGRSASAPGRTKTVPSSAAVHGRSAVAPGRTKTSPNASPHTGMVHGRSSTAPGQTKTAPGQTKTAPGQTKTTSTSTRPSKKP